MSEQVNEFHFFTEIEVRISDINYGGHVSNDKYLTLFHDARIRYLNLFGFSEFDIGDNLGLIMTESFVKYKAEAFLGDILKIGVRISEIKQIKFKMAYLILRVSDNKLIGSGYTIMAGFHYSLKKAGILPGCFIEKVKRFEKSL